MNHDDLVLFRRKLHANAELSGNENITVKLILEKLNSFQPDKIIYPVGENSIAAVYNSGIEGNTVVLRADIDALPIQEKNQFSYKSQHEGVAHLCGHDGHSAILIGVAEYLAENRPLSGKVVLLFQSAEETGEGAAKVVNDPQFVNLNPKLIFGLHNLPSFEVNTIVHKSEVFSLGSTGLTLRFIGKTSHAAEPEKGISPLSAVMNTVEFINEQYSNTNSDLVVTIVNIVVGEKAFGTSPGYGEVNVTIRSNDNGEIVNVAGMITKFTLQECSKAGLTLDYELVESFPVTENNDRAYKLLKETIDEQNVKNIILNKPFRWSEDFGHYSKVAGVCFFGLGVGKNYVNLHDEMYDFNDAVIPTGINMFAALVNKLCG